MISKGNAKKKKKKKHQTNKNTLKDPENLERGNRKNWRRVSALQIIFHLPFPLGPPCRVPCSLCSLGSGEHQEPSQGSTPHSLPHQDDAAVCNHMGQSHRAQKSTLFIKKHVFTTLSKLSERMYLPTVHCWEEQEKSDFKGSLNWNAEYQRWAQASDSISSCSTLPSWQFGLKQSQAIPLSQARLLYDTTLQTDYWGNSGLHPRLLPE